VANTNWIGLLAWETSRTGPLLVVQLQPVRFRGSACDSPSVPPQFLRRRVVLEGLLPALGGSLGMALAYLTTGSLVGMLLDVSVNDPLVLAGSIVALMMVAGLACYSPPPGLEVDPVITGDPSTAASNVRRRSDLRSRS
jgi:hypothetical protein